MGLTTTDTHPDAPTVRDAPLAMSGDEFRRLGHRLVDRLAGLLDGLAAQPVSPGERPADVRAALGDLPLPRQGTDPVTLLDAATDLLVEHSPLNGHPRFWGYVMGSPAPIGALADLLAAVVNPNVGGWAIAPMATEIEAQAVRWIAELLGYPAGCGGLLVSGGNMANFVGVLAARRAKAGWDVRAAGLRGEGSRQLRLYASAETHTWVQKAADLFGLGTDAIGWVPTDAPGRLDPAALRRQVQADRAAGLQPFLVVGTAGTVSTGAIDPLPALVEICRAEDLWLHVDGAYGGFAAMLPDAPTDLLALREADSVAIVPHKWLYAPLEAGCVLVREPALLRDAFSFHPPYYRFDGADGDDAPVNFYEYGPQNSRGFRALKVWLALQQAGRDGYVRMLSDDIALARDLFRSVQAYAELEALTQSLSITTFRYVPPDLTLVGAARERYLNALNQEIVARIQDGGEAYVSQAVIDGTFALRFCCVNFRTTRADVAALPPLVVRHGRALDAERRGWRHT